MLPLKRPNPHAVASFVVGAGVMAVELTASRLLAPVYGGSLYVWTSIIVTVLLAMAFGYRFGGRLAGRGGGLRETGWLLVAGSFTLLLGLVLLALFAQYAAIAITLFASASLALFFGSLLTSAAAFAAPVFLLAAASPVILKSWIGQGDAGVVSGRYFAVSTVGSVLGTVAPTLWLVPTLGARLTLGAVAAAFLVTGLFLLEARHRLAVTAVFALIALGTLPDFSARNPKVIATVESPYQLIRVFLDGTRRELRFNEATAIQSWYDPASPVTGLYWDMLALVPNLRPAEKGPQRVAILGFATGTAARTMLLAAPPSAAPRITGVEVDPAVVKIAREHFDLDDLPVEVQVMDGRMFLASTKEKFDVIFVDAYGTQLYIPAHMATREFFALAKSRLNPGGVLLLNVNAARNTSPLLVALTNSVAAEFPHVRDVAVKGSWNHQIFASDEDIDIQAAFNRTPRDWALHMPIGKVRRLSFNASGPMLTDDRAPVDVLTDAMLLEETLRKQRAH